MEQALNDVILQFKEECAKALNYCATGNACYSVSEAQKAFIIALESIRDILVLEKRHP